MNSHRRELFPDFPDSGRKIIATKDHTTIINGAGDPTAIKDHLRALRCEIERNTSDYNGEKL
ncbi:MAG: hypothetical protein RLP44_27420 [Aggregatilineales bacterium]